MFGLTRVGTQPLRHYHNELDDIFPGWFFPETEAGILPSLNVWEDGNNLFVEAEVPGLKTGEVEVTVTGNELTIHGERKEGGRNRRAISFTRTVGLPEGIDAEKAAAALEDGILTVTLPKAETAKPRRIEIAVKK